MQYFIHMAILLICSSPSWASAVDIPAQLHYQHYVTDGGGQALHDAEIEVSFYIKDSTQAVLYSEEQTRTVHNGLLSTNIGDNTGIPLEVFSPHDTRYLEVWIDNVLVDDMLEIVSVPYAYWSQRAMSVAEQSIELSHLSQSLQDAFTQEDEPHSHDSLESSLVALEQRSDALETSSTDHNAEIDAISSNIDLLTQTVQSLGSSIAVHMADDDAHASHDDLVSNDTLNTSIANITNSLQQYVDTQIANIPEPVLPDITPTPASLRAWGFVHCLPTSNQLVCTVGDNDNIANVTVETLTHQDSALTVIAVHFAQALSDSNYLAQAATTIHPSIPFGSLPRYFIAHRSSNTVYVGVLDATLLSPQAFSLAVLQ